MNAQYLPDLAEQESLGLLLQEIARSPLPQARPELRDGQIWLVFDFEQPQLLEQPVPQIG
jgi:hypothetical protein